MKQDDRRNSASMGEDVKDLVSVLQQGIKVGKTVEKRLSLEEREPSILLHPNIPKPLHGVNPRTILGSGWWNKERKAASEATSDHCLACGVHKSRARYRQWMEGHELYEIDYERGRMTYLRTVPLCPYCHNYIHSGRMLSLLEKGQFKVNQYRAIVEHGHQVIADAGLEVPSSYDGEVAAWGDWRLVLDGKEYPPKFKTSAQWAAAFQRSPSREGKVDG